MRALVAIAILLVGCATQTPDTSVAAKSSLEQAEQRLDQTEEKCIEEAVMSDNALTSNVVMPLGALSLLEIQALFFKRDVSHCVANANEASETIAEDDRTLYENAEGLDRKVPLPVLTMSLSR
jgi:hypothetical protein